MKHPCRLAAASLFLVWVHAAGAAEAGTPLAGVVSLQASAALEVAKDLMSVTFSTTREGPDANAVQAALKQALDAALGEARRAAKPGQVEVQTGNFSLYPRYAAKGVLAGWQGTAELIVEGRDMPAIGQLAGRIASLTVARVGYGLSRETREKNEGEVAAQAIARFRAKAADYAKQFGYAGYTVREVNVGVSEAPGAPVPMMRAQAMSLSREESPLPVEAGKALVSVAVTGSVQMK